MTERTCENCWWYDFGICDKSGRLKEADDTCPKWSDSGEEDDGK